MTGNKSHYANAFSNWGALGINALLAFILTPIVIRYIGQDGYGLWIILMSIVGYYGFLDMGITTAILRYIARYAAQKDITALNKTVNTSLAIFSAIGLAIILSSFFTAIPLAHFFNIDPSNIVEFSKAIQLLSFTILLRFYAGVFKCSLIAREYFIPANSVEIVCSITRASLTFLLLYKGWGLVGIAVSHAVSSLIMLIAHFILCKKYIPEICIQIKSISRKTRNNLLTFGGVTVIISATDMLRLNLDSFVIAKMIGLPAVGIYAVAALLVNNVRQLVIAAVGIFNPRFAALEGQGEQQKLIQVFMQSLFVCGLIAFSLGSTLLFFGEDFINLWVGDKFADAIPVLFALIIANTIAISQCVSLSLMYALKKHQWYATLSSIEAFFNVMLSIYLASQYGILGVALGTAIPMICISGIIQPFYISRMLNISVKSYISYLLPGAFLGFFIVSSIAYIGNLVFLKVSYIIIGSQILLSLTVTLLSLIVVGKNTRTLQNLRPWQLKPQI
jgi:O-antigen/teichoic acid export membrane protein